MTKKIAFYDKFCVSFEIYETLREMGVSALGFSNIEELPKLASENRDIGFVLSINFNEELHRACVELDKAYAAWTFDSGTFASVSKLPKDRLRGKDFLFLFNRRDYNECAKFHKNSYYLPFSASKSFERAPLETGLKYDILSVMNTYRRTVFENEEIFKRTHEGTNGELEKKSLELVKSLMELVVERHKNVMDKNMMMEYLREYIEQCGHNPFNEKYLFTMCENYGQILSCMQRELCVGALCSTGERVDVFGDPCWREVLKSCPNATCHPNAEYLELPGLYNNGRVNLNLNQIQNLDCVPQRIFHLMAAGGFILTNHFDELESLFEVGAHLETFRDAEELKSKAVYYLRHDAKRLEIARRGHEEFLKNHRMTDKMAFIMREVENSL